MACTGTLVPRIASARSALLFSEINAFRRRNGQRALTLDRSAERHATAHAQRMAQAGHTMGHPDLASIEGDLAWDRLVDLAVADDALEGLLPRAITDARTRQRLLDDHDRMAAVAIADPNGRWWASVLLFHTAPCARD